MTKQTSVLIDNKEMDLSYYLTKITTEPYDKENEKPNFKTSLEIEDYSDLAYTISSLIGVCQVALRTIAENEDLKEIEKEKYLGADLLQVVQVLKVAKNLLPIAEFEMLTELQNVVNPTKIK